MEVAVLIFAIPLTAVSAAEMIFDFFCFEIVFFLFVVLMTFFADSSCLCHLRFFSFFFGRDVGDNNIHNVRNVFVPFDADDVVIICEFCRTEVVISNRL